LRGGIGFVFYDVTTLYFESAYGDEWRSTNFTKDGKHNQPQVVLGLLVNTGGYPLSYSLFNGSQYEGYTLLLVVEDFVKRFALESFDNGNTYTKTMLLTIRYKPHCPAI
jgi:transposase